MSPSEKSKITIVIPADLRFSNSIRNFFGDLLHVKNISDIWINRLILAIDEIFMNAVKYGSRDNEENVYITIDFSDKELIFIIEDSGTGISKIDPAQLQKLIWNNKEDTSLSKTSGRGLAMIVNNWTNSFIIEKSSYGGIKITAKKNLDDILNKPKEIQNISITDMPDVLLLMFTHIDKHESEEEAEMVKNIESSSKTKYIFDFQKLTYINSVFIGLLAKLYNLIAAKKGKVVIINLSAEAIQDTLKLVGLTDIIPVVNSMEEAKDILFSS